jgi:hypothetical protein
LPPFGKTLVRTGCVGLSAHRLFYSLTARVMTVTCRDIFGSTFLVRHAGAMLTGGASLQSRLDLGACVRKGEQFDRQVNDWLAESGVKVRKTSAAFQRLRDRGTDALTGKTISRRAVGIVISIWYDEEEGSKRFRSRPSSWEFQ